MFFQIYKNGQPVDGGSYPSLEEAAAALERAQQGGEVTEVDRLRQNRASLYAAGVPRCGPKVSPRNSRLSALQGLSALQAQLLMLRGNKPAPGTHD